MPLSTITNATLDAALAAIPGPYGPLTRTGTDTDLTVNPIAPNSMLKLHFKSTVNTDIDVYASYDQLVDDTQVRDDILEDAFGLRAKIAGKLDPWVTQMNAVINGANFNALTMTEGAVVNAWMSLLRMFVSLVELGIDIPWEAYHEIDGHNREVFNATFALVDNANVVTLTNNSTGQYQVALVDWGDNSIELWRGEDLVHDYTGAAAGAYTVRMVLVGPKGVDFHTDVVNV